MKAQIEELLNVGEIEKASELLEQYKSLHPKDADIYTLETCMFLYNGQLQEAEEVARMGVRTLPTSVDMHYNLANVLEQKEQFYEAMKEYMIVQSILELCEGAGREELHIGPCIESITEKWISSASSTGNVEVIEKVKDDMEKIEKLSRNCFSFFEKAFNSSVESLIGDYYYENENIKRYVGLYSDQYSIAIDQEKSSVVNVKGEFLEVTEGYEYNYTDNRKCLLPIATEEYETSLRFQTDIHQINVNQRYWSHFYYYPINEPINISANKRCYFGKPVYLQKNEKNKALVLNIFVDGLAETILHGDGIKNIMPSTYKFFSKGVICENVFNTAEWTYPSIANYVTSLSTTDHMMFHNKIDIPIRQDVKTLAEYFQDAGYYTAKYCGNWRITPQYGHARGYQRFIFQNQLKGFKVNTVVSEVLDHIETFEDTNQFIWMSIGDLHDIADGLFLPTRVTKNISIENQQAEDVGATSAKQNYSNQKTIAFIEQAKYVDFWLGILFEYIEKKYQNEEILVSLFSDHGQGYMIPEGGHFIAKERSNVAFMFRGSGIAAGVTRELMSTSDYLPIMCHVANIPLCDNPIEGQLPVWFGGKKEREFAYSESLHPGDPYYAAIFLRDGIVYFQSGGRCDDEGRFELGEYKIWMEDYEHNPIAAAEKINHYENIVLEHIAHLLIYGG